MTDESPHRRETDPVSLRVFGIRVPITAKGLTLSVLFVAAGTGGPMLLASSTGLATADDVAALRETIPTTETVRAEYKPRLDALDERVATNTATIQVLVTSTTVMQQSIYEGRAETLAREIADKERDAGRRLRVRQVVYDRALSNLRRGDPIHDGLGDYLR